MEKTQGRHRQGTPARPLQAVWKDSLSRLAGIVIKDHALSRVIKRNEAARRQQVETPVCSWLCDFGKSLYISRAYFCNKMRM